VESAWVESVLAESGVETKDTVAVSREGSSTERQACVNGANNNELTLARTMTRYDEIRKLDPKTVEEEDEADGDASCPWAGKDGVTGVRDCSRGGMLPP